MARPSFVITRKNVPLGHVETKDVGTPLGEIEKAKGPHGQQFKRYRDGLPNWILTDYLEFHWYVAGERRLTARLGNYDAKKKTIQILPGGEDEAGKLLDAFFKQPALTVESAKDLAARMAGMTRVVRDLIAATFQFGSAKDKKQLNSWLAAFKEVLIPDLHESDFSDMFTRLHWLTDCLLHVSTAWIQSRHSLARWLRTAYRKLIHSCESCSLE